MSKHPCKEKAAVLIKALDLPREFMFSSSTDTQICFVADRWLLMEDVREALTLFAEDVLEAPIDEDDDNDDDTPMWSLAGRFQYGDVARAGDYDEIEWVRDNRLRSIRVENRRAALGGSQMRRVLITIRDVKYKPKALE